MLLSWILDLRAVCIVCELPNVSSIVPVSVDKPVRSCDQSSDTQSLLLTRRRHGWHCVQEKVWIELHDDKERQEYKYSLVEWKVDEGVEAENQNTAKEGARETKNSADGPRGARWYSLVCNS